MRYSFGVHRMDEAELINVLIHLGEEFGPPFSAFAMLFVGPKWLHQAKLTIAFSSLSNSTRIFKRHRLPIARHQVRLVVERIDMAHAPLHE